MKKCLICKSDIKVDKKQAISVRESRQYCSNACASFARRGIKRPEIGIKISLKLKGIKRSYAYKNLGKYSKQGNIAWNKGLHYFQIAGEKHPYWKGNNTSYRSLHKWVKRWLGKVKECVYCGKQDFEGRIEWASISHHAMRNLNDFIPLCVTCHRRYDKKGRI